MSAELSQPSTKVDSSRRLNLARNLLLGAAGLSLLVSVSLWFSGSREEGLFVGLWVPSVLAAGNLYILTKRPV